ncbi:MAG: hypothetical protein R3B36_16990 [Polyangiaceae bacterium]
MTPSRRRQLMIAAPLLSVATLMVGLRVGAKDATRSATVVAAPPTSRGIAWQIVTYIDDRAVREVAPVRGLVVTARSGGREATWRGDSNVDGVAEAWLPLEGLNATSVVDIEVRADGEAEPLAGGQVHVREEPWGPERSDVAARPTKKTGDIDIEVLVDGERLVPGFPVSMWVHTSGGPHEGLEITAKPEPGLRVEPSSAKPCAPGWTELVVTAEAHVVGVTLEAHTASGQTGTWFGALPVAPGAFHVSMDRHLEAQKPAKVVLLAPNPRKIAYLEVDDARGRHFAAALDVRTEPGDPTPRAALELPPLPDGLYWLAISGDTRGTDAMLGAAVAKPFVVGKPAALSDTSACGVGAFLAKNPGSRFLKWDALDGLSSRRGREAARRRIGLLIGVLSLLVAAMIEAVLIGQGAKEAREQVAAALADADDATDAGAEARRQHIARTGGAGNVVVGLLLALLGFGLLAAFAATR